ncbi:FG-GAP-like repeat-containing protein [Streptomyces sp. CB00072]|uniref:FG-GAP-like repeat-containing protein n=1 Tax=Streptomyces sp. CB00072 TaxID=1703928 RepID=UPI0009A113EC|nr:FG-GAP-like repeat-containing protein [Streptomyces sp. CB00072]
MSRPARVERPYTRQRVRAVTVALAVTGIGCLAWPGAAQAAPGAAPASRSDFNNDRIDDLIAGIPQASSAAGQVSILPGSGSGPGAAGLKVISQSGSVPGSPEPGDLFGADVAYGDVDGDGLTDLAVGSPGEADSVFKERGNVTVLTGSSQLTQGDYFTTADDDPRNPGKARLGTAVAMGDITGDGLDDVVGVGLGSAGSGGWLVWRDSATNKATTLRLTFEDLNHVDVAAGDFNGDGFDDVAVTTVDRYGQARAYEYPSAGRTGLTHALAIQMGAGRTIDAGDINQDGRDDIVIGRPAPAETTPGHDGATGGQVTVKLGQDYGLYYRGHTTTISQSTPNVPGEAEEGDAMGSSVALRDLNGDNTLDIITGLPGQDSTVGTVTSADAGSVLLLHLSTTPDGITLQGATGLSQGTGGIGGGGEPGDQLGTAVTAGNFTGNGTTGLVLGAAGENNGDGTTVYRTATGTASFLGKGIAGAPTGSRLGSVLTS